jgi:hypothetical protein
MLGSAPGAIAYLVRQLVFVGRGIVGEMCGKLLADGRDSANDRRNRLLLARRISTNSRCGTPDRMPGQREEEDIN